ncbi:hypothetical protein QO207_13980 [Pseudomonas sp. CAN2814]|uniref:hypothetical protein n=1 Tax=Pseudomonas sp. CAN1 TaxID=3046726 RepID=UPI0026482233|nr:hypothetical protein [Pseudomonas sp. CAN1]MDN6857702.1 hypothetical protein [Pseudomonas sp. CAN1]
MKNWILLGLCLLVTVTLYGTYQNTCPTFVSDHGDLLHSAALQGICGFVDTLVHR